MTTINKKTFEIDKIRILPDLDLLRFLDVWQYHLATF